MASTLTAWPRRPGGASSTISAVATPPTRASKQTATRRMTASAASEGANALAKFASEKPHTPIAMSRRRPKRSARVASGRGPRAPRASTEPRFESAGVRALKSEAIAGRASTSTEPSNAARTTANPAQINVRRCSGSSSITLLDQAQSLQKVRAGAKKATRRADVCDRYAEQRRRSRQQPKGEAQRHADQRGGEGVGPGPPAEPVIEDVGDRADGKAGGHAEDGPQPALNQPAKEGLLDRTVDDVQAGLKPGVVRAGGNA